MYLRMVVALVVAALVAATPAGAQTPFAPEQSAGERQAGPGFRYSDLLSAIERETVREAVLVPDRAEVSVVLANGREETLGYPPGQGLADRLAEAGATVEVAASDDGEGIGFFGIAVLALIVLSVLMLVVSLRSRRNPARRRSRRRRPAA